MMPGKPVNDFKFKHFKVSQQRAAMRVNTDGVLLGAWSDVALDARILDVGTGTGVIALMAAQRSRSAEVVGIEIDKASFLDADANAKASAFANRLKMIHTSLQDYAAAAPPSYDHILSNPPYFQSGTLSSSRERVGARHTVSLTFDDLLDCSSSMLGAQGRLSVILPTLAGEAFQEMAVSRGMHLQRCCQVYINETTLGRLLLTFAKSDGPVPIEPEQLLIRTADGSYTAAYQALTRDFYLHF